MPEIVRVVRKTDALASSSVLLTLAVALAAVLGCAQPSGREAATIRVGSCNVRTQPGDVRTPNAWDERKAVFSVSADHADCLYACGEQATFTVSALQAAGTAVATLDDFSTNVVARATFDLSKTNTFTISGTLAEPGFMRLRVGVSGGARQKIYGVGF